MVLEFCYSLRSKKSGNVEVGGGGKVSGHEVSLATAGTEY